MFLVQPCHECNVDNWIFSKIITFMIFTNYKYTTSIGIGICSSFNDMFSWLLLLDMSRNMCQSQDAELTCLKNRLVVFIYEWKELHIFYCVSCKVLQCIITLWRMLFLNVLFINKRGLRTYVPLKNGPELIYLANGEFIELLLGPYSPLTEWL